ncbi:IS3 family transposase [Gordonia amicalis]|uniref:IS3 family transposase n=3 Tax=Gordonia amicalis TaxID=89053 RepID=A0AAE4R762_9ACTN|nr:MULTISPECIES: IS3 family transposase [Gordonia]MBA5846171.1 IS3 family transposase [Gordonia amicalis]MCZ0911686.1 IS3 family transposase [Gordonia amicalis]MDV6314750.1 IS3 family transposase [Gordonia amicalis]UPW13276.1 IS3 family transposase [Gordonia amicalis]UPW13279.1 IS3 family transposase [Gordonia amicalis]
MVAPRKYPDELRERATRMAIDARKDPAVRAGALKRIADQLGVHPEALRTWVKRAETDEGLRPGTTSDDAARIAELERENRELRRANTILKQASGFLRDGVGPSTQMKVEFIDRHKHEHGVQPICEALEQTDAAIAPSTYYAATARPEARRTIRDRELTEQITTIHAENYGVYGVRKVHAELKRQQVPVARCTVERLMRKAGLKGIVRAKGPRTTRPKAETERPADLVERRFVADAPNELWVADITYVKTFSGWVYAAFVIDVFSRMVVGWQVATSLYTDLALDALEMAIWRRTHGGADLSGLVHHSDRGVQYRAVRYTERLADAEAVASVGSRGDSYDNAMAEAYNSLFKAELIRNKGPWQGIDDVEIAVAEYVDWFNQRRLHGEIGHVPPAEFEELHWQAHGDNLHRILLQETS